MHLQQCSVRTTPHKSKLTQCVVNLPRKFNIWHIIQISMAEYIWPACDLYSYEVQEHKCMLYIQRRVSVCVAEPHTCMHVVHKTWELPPISTIHSTEKPVTTKLTYPWKCTVLHCNHLGNTWKPLVLMTWHFDYCPSANEGDNQSVRSSAPVVSRCFQGGYNVKLYISWGRLAWWLLTFLHSGIYIHVIAHQVFCIG